MSEELRDVLAGAEAATAQALPGFDPAVMTRSATRRSIRRRAVRAVGTTAAAIVGVGALGVGAYAVVDRLGEGPAVVPTTPVPTVSATVGPEPTPVVDDTPLPGHTVTVGDGLPSASALTQGALDAVTTDWVLAVYDSTFRGSSGANVDGERVLYLVSPDGMRYEVANLTKYDSLNLLAWDSTRGKALLSEDRASAIVVDFASGTVAGEWQLCGEGVSIVGAARDGGWGIWGACQGEGFDGLYADDGSLLSTDGYFQSTWGTTVTLVGDVQVVYEFEVPPDQKFKAVAADGTVTPMQVPSTTSDCYPVAAGADGVLVAACWDESGGNALWALPVDGSAPATMLGDADLLALVGEAAPTSTGLTYGAYCTAGERGVFSATDGTFTELFILHGGPQAVPNDGEYPPVRCYPSASGLVVVTGVGPLWSWNPDTDAVVTLLPVPEPSDDGTWVGAAENGVIVHP